MLLITTLSVSLLISYAFGSAVESTEKKSQQFVMNGAIVAAQVGILFLKF